MNEQPTLKSLLDDIAQTCIEKNVVGRFRMGEDVEITFTPNGEQKINFMNFLNSWRQMETR